MDMAGQTKGVWMTMACIHLFSARDFDDLIYVKYKQLREGYSLPALPLQTIALPMHVNWMHTWLMV